MTSIATVVSVLLYQGLLLAGAVTGRPPASDSSYLAGLATFAVPFLLLMAAEAVGLPRLLTRLCASLGFLALALVLGLILTDQAFLVAPAVLFTYGFFFCRRFAVYMRWSWVSRLSQKDVATWRANLTWQSTRTPYRLAFASLLSAGHFYVRPHMNTLHERAVIASIVRFVVRACIAVFVGSFLAMLVVWGSESLGLLNGWAFMHSGFAFPTMIGAIALTFWVTGHVPYLKRRKGNDDAV